MEAKFAIRTVGPLMLLMLAAAGMAGASEQAGPQSPRARLLDRCCQVGRERAIESASFNCKLAAREALGPGGGGGERASQLVALSQAETLFERDVSFADQCEMVLESCCLAHHRTRNCNSGKQFAKSGSACMDVELSKEATVATESFNDCCMACSLGVLAARNPPPGVQAPNESTKGERCRLLSPLASSLAGQLYEQTYAECCHEHLPRPSGALRVDSGALVDCARNAGVCAHRCLTAGSPDPVTQRPLERDRCDCFAGYKLAPDGLSCQDVDECKLNLHTCNRHSELCDNTRGSFRCLARGSQQLRARTPPTSAAAEEAEVAEPQPFVSLRLCPPGWRWQQAEGRCGPSEAQHWKRGASAFAPSAHRRNPNSGAAVE